MKMTSANAEMKKRLGENGEKAAENGSIENSIAKSGTKPGEITCCAPVRSLAAASRWRKRHMKIRKL
jgi:hypothetical protein